jgi:DNA polymerase-1
LNTNEANAKYSCLDGVVTYEIWKKISPDIHKQGHDYSYDQVIKLIKPLSFMMTRGLRVDREALKETHEKVSLDIDEKSEELTKLCGISLNPGSPKQMQQYFYGILGLPIYTKKGKATTDDKALARIVRKGGRGSKEAKLCQEIRRLRKLKSSYLDVTVDEDNRIRCFYKPRGTRNGRTSSAQTIFGTGLNLQNLDPRFKSFIVPDEGYVFFEMDKRQAEWVVTAYVSGDGQMIAAVESKEDIHARTASLITGLPVDIILRESKIVGHHTDPDTILELRRTNIPEIEDLAIFLPRIFSCRQAGKKSNHALNYIMMFRRFALENEIPEDDAKKIVAGYHRSYPGLELWYDRIKTELSKDRILTNCFGRSRRFLNEWSDDLIRDAVSFIPQSTVADIKNEALIKIYDDEEDFMYKIDLMAEVHDSILMQYPINNWLDMAKAVLRCRDYMNPVMTYSARSFKIGTDMKIGTSWGGGDMMDVSITDNIMELADRLETSYAKLKEAT